MYCRMLDSLRSHNLDASSDLARQNVGSKMRRKCDTWASQHAALLFKAPLPMLSLVLLSMV
jgi:hypothetical protein